MTIWAWRAHTPALLSPSVHGHTTHTVRQPQPLSPSWHILFHHSHTHTDTCTHNHIPTVTHTLGDNAHISFCTLTCHHMHKNFHTTLHCPTLTSKHKPRTMGPIPLPHHSPSVAPEPWMVFPRRNCLEDGFSGDLLAGRVIPELRTGPTSLAILSRHPTIASPQGVRLTWVPILVHQSPAA